MKARNVFWRNAGTAEEKLVAPIWEQALQTGVYDTEFQMHF
jgi:hypothetical protein